LLSPRGDGEDGGGGEDGGMLA